MPEPSLPISPQTRSPHLCSRATRKSLSSLPRNPLAKGLFSIFSCVICRERTHRRVTGVEDWAGLGPSSLTPGTFRTHGTCRNVHTPALGLPGILRGPPWPHHSHLARHCLLPIYLLQFVFCSYCAQSLIILSWVPVIASCPCHLCPGQLPYRF